MNNAKKFLLLISFIFCLLVNILIISKYDNSNNIKIITNPNEIVEKYADENNIEIEILSDSTSTKYVKKIEQFSYNVVSNGIEITKYLGKSKELIIPNKINGRNVVSLKEGFLKDTTVNKVILNKNVNTLKVEDFEKIDILCYENTLCNNLKIDETLNVTILSDSDYYNFDNSTLEFEYNYEDKIEITKYLGNEEIIIIPTNINGIEVNSINLDKEVLENKSIYLPSTIKDINFNFDNSMKMHYLKVVVLNIITFVIVALVIILYRNKDKNETFLNTPVYLISILYLLIQYIYMLYNYGNNVILTYVIITIVYLIIVLPLILIKKKLKTYDEDVKNSGEFIRNVLSKLDDIEINKDNEEILNRVKETIRYSDPVSSDMTRELENEILEKISNDNIDEVEKLIIKRNKICKENK